MSSPSPVPVPSDTPVAVDPAAAQLAATPALPQATDCLCDSTVGGFVYNCPTHAKHVMVNGKSAWQQIPSQPPGRNSSNV